ncbi:MAG: hypothetical protein CK426_03625 [Legionella sp.]|nr:MAG: hypothetical protein CK423_05815 [Legionella sp.]PJD99107.1 MAG: hypothetical protein CK426_03625 [Legionella sp.]
MNILVTGGCGFIGSHIAEYHLSRGDKVTVVDNLSTGSLSNIDEFKNDKLTFIHADILSWGGLEKEVAKADRIYHMAAVLGVFRVIERPIEMLTTNILGCHNILNAMVSSKSKARLIVASSSSAYGRSKQQVLAEQDDLIICPYAPPLWGYAVSKIADEAFCMAYHQQYDLPVTIVRIFNTVGPRQTGLYGMVIPRFVQQACSNTPITVYGEGTQIRSFCDVRDTVVMLDLIAEKNISIGEPINVGKDSELSINSLAELVKQKADSQSPITYLSYEKAYGVAFTDILHRKPDLTKLRALTDFKHQWSLDSTIEDLIQRQRQIPR